MEMCQTFSDLSFVVHPEKPVLTVRLTTEKKRKIFDLCQEVLQKCNTS